MQTEFTPLMSLFGGSLIGIAAVLLMAFHGRIAGLSGMVSGLIPPISNAAPADWQWRAAFLAGAILAPALWIMLGNTMSFAVPVSTLSLIIGGIIVGIGVTFASGCTSGHGICGMARLSPRSIIATLVFMASCGMTVFIIRHMI